ncbi:MAG: hypothetical protein IJX88_06355 [Clostridia bacterium]|nr:hypothetical protein [Clostridia bacterium]
MKGKRLLASVFACVLLFGGVGCKDEEVKKSDITVYMPDGAPALALAQLMHEDTENDGVTYSVVAPTEIKTKVTYKDMAKNADLCVLPVTAGAKLLGSGENYQMLGAVTRGNLYLLGKTDETFTADTLSGLLGKTVGVLQINEVPGLTFKATLNTLGIAYNELTGATEKKADAVNLKAITDASAIDPASDTDYWLVAEPAVSLQMKKKNLYRVGDLQALYGGGYTQAVLVAKSTFVDSNTEWLKGFLAKVKTGGEWLLTAEAAKIVSAVTAHLDDPAYESTLKAPMLTAQALSHCGIEFRSALVCKTETNVFLTKLNAVNAKAAVVPQDAFYCMVDFGV